MELKSLVLGLLFSVGIFALKGGFGMHYLRLRTRSSKRLVLAFAFYLALYAGLFGGAAVLVEKLDLVAHFPTLRRMAENGMAIHLSLAALMFFWGMWLLKDSGLRQGTSCAWLLLVLPCPLCLLVIFCSVALLRAAFPAASGWAISLLWVGFCGLSLLMSAVLGYRRTRSETSPETALASALIGIAAYFLLTILIAPQFADLDEIYRLAAYSSADPNGSAPWWWVILAAVLTLLLCGHLLERYQIRRNQPWK